ncbi:MAG: replicative DNA helicase [bacterium]
MTYKTTRERTDEHSREPQSIDVERDVIGSILKDAEALHQTIEVLDDEAAFYHPKHRLIYGAILKLYQRSEPCDITTVTNALLDSGNLEQAGGRVHLVELVENVASTANTPRHAEIVKEKYLLRRLIQTSNEIVRSCYSTDETVESLLDHAEQHIFSISEQRLHKGFTSIKELIPSTFEEIEDLQSEDSSLLGVKTGFEKLDEMTNGLHKGDFVIIAGRPSMGKSALAVNIAEHVGVIGKKVVGIFSLEMSMEQLALRMLCGRARISQQRLRARKLRDEEWQKLTIAGGPLSEAPIFIDDSAILTSLEIRAKARRLKAQHGLDLIIVDYIQMVSASGRYENRQQEMAGISRNLKALAKELEIPVIGCSQLSRQVEQRGGEKRPQLSDLRESGAIEQDADVVMFIYRPEHYMLHLERNDPKFKEVERKAEIIMAKQRNGPTGMVILTFLREFARFENMAPSGYREIPAGVEPVEGGDMPF